MSLAASLFVVMLINLINFLSEQHDLSKLSKLMRKGEVKELNFPNVPLLRLELQQETPPEATLETLMSRVEWMRYCELCDSEQRFVAGQRCDRGLIAKCSKCGDLRLVPFTRTNGESSAREAYT